MTRCLWLIFSLTGLLVFENFTQTFAVYDAKSTETRTKQRTGLAIRIEKSLRPNITAKKLSWESSYVLDSTTQSPNSTTMTPTNSTWRWPRWNITTTPTTTPCSPRWDTSTPTPHTTTWPWTRWNTTSTYLPNRSTMGTTISPYSDLCSCTYSTIWLDVFFIVDSSFAMQRHGLDEATDYLLSVLSKMSVGLYSYETRVGFIYYADMAHVLSDLTEWRNTDSLIDELSIPFDGNRGTNIEQAIKLASDQFSTNGHRKNAKKVIVIVASSYEDGDYNDPTQAADIFKNDGGIIITVEYVQEHGEAVPFLNQLASPGYNLTNRYLNLDADDMRNLFCRANCFCPANYKQFSNAYDGSIGGCYYPVNIPSIQRLAQRYCQHHRNSTLVKIEDSSKAQFLKKLFPSKTKFWIGLKRRYENYFWQDGSELFDYSMWAPGYPQSSGGDCVYMYQYSGFRFGWFNEDCSNDLNYICQTRPCDTSNYCDLPDNIA